MYQSIFEQLCDLERIYGELLALAEKKQPILQANRDSEALLRITQQEECLIERAAQVERERMKGVERIAYEMGVPLQQLTATQIAHRAGGEQEAALLAKGQALVDLLMRLKRQNQINRQLLEINLSLASFMLNGLAQADSPSSIYGASGDEVEDATQMHRILDSEI